MDLSDSIPQSQSFYSSEAERSVIASIVSESDGGVYDDLASIITEDDFYESANREVFKAVGRLVNQKTSIDEVTLSDELRSSNKLDQVGGIAYIFKIMDAPCTPLSGMSSAKIVRKHSQSRKLARHYRLQLECLTENQSPSDVATKSETEIRSIMDSVDTKKETLKDSAEELRTRLNSMYDGTYQCKKIPTGIDHLDDKLDEGGIGKGEVCVIAAPTSCGKSQLALNFVLRNSIVDNIPSCIFSFEMPANQLTKRMAQTSSCINLGRYKDAMVTTEQREKVDEAITKIGKAPIYTEHSVRGIDDLRSKARRMKRRHGIEIVVVDYLQLIPFKSNLSKHEGISQASHGIKQMAMELDVAVILLVQVNRTGAMRDSGLVLYDLKDSGDIENDADIALLMWPRGGSVDHCRETDANGVSYLAMDYNVAKNREGERDLHGTFTFLNHIGRFQ
jgi:replicative DNA helicase